MMVRRFIEENYNFDEISYIRTELRVRKIQQILMDDKENKYHINELLMKDLEELIEISKEICK